MKDVEGASSASVVGTDEIQQEVLAVADYHRPHVDGAGARVRAKFRARPVSLPPILISSGELL